MEPMALTHEDCSEALAVGRTIDLSGIRYGPDPWSVRGPSSDAHDYYSLLAGIVRGKRLRHIVEIGTHFGGAILSMDRGLDPSVRPTARLVTVDLSLLNQDGFSKSPGIVRIQGDSLAASTIDRVVRNFDGPIDLLFVDAVHTYRQTWENVAVYANRLSPRLVALDDIRLNSGMRALWTDLQETGCGEFLDVSELVDRSDAGFGIIGWRMPIRLDEWSAHRRAAWQFLWAVRRGVSGVVPRPIKERLSRVVHRRA